MAKRSTRKSARPVKPRSRKTVSARAATKRGRKSKPVLPRERAPKADSVAKTVRAAPVAKSAAAVVKPTASRSKPSLRLRPQDIVLSDSALAAAATAKPLTREDTAEFREMLIRKRAEILGDMTNLQSETLNKSRRDAAGDLSSMPIHMADLGSDNYELEFTLGLIEGERAILKEIEESLERIKNGTYGVCIATGRPIGKARLKAKPWAKYCYEYTLAQETGQAHRL